MSLEKALAKLIPQITYSYKAFPANEQSLEVLEHQLRLAGNTIEKINHEEGSILCQQFTENSDSWGCMLCLNDSQIILCDSENELRKHLEFNHEGWIINEEGLPIVVE